MGTDSSLHPRALTCAVIHFLFCLWFGTAILIFSATASGEPSWFLKLMSLLFEILEFPAVLFCRLPFNSMWMYTDVPLVAFLWSISLGYLVSFIWCQNEKWVLARLIREAETSIPEPQPKKLRTAVLWLLALFAMYILSIGPVTRFAPEWAEALYPTDTLEDIPFVGPLVEYWIDLWKADDP
jgi:hypothetical protein